MISCTSIAGKIIVLHLRKLRCIQLGELFVIALVIYNKEGNGVVDGIHKT